MRALTNRVPSHADEVAWVARRAAPEPKCALEPCEWAGGSDRCLYADQKNHREVRDTEVKVPYPSPLRRGADQDRGKSEQDNRDVSYVDRNHEIGSCPPKHRILMANEQIGGVTSNEDVVPKMQNSYESPLTGSPVLIIGLSIYLEWHAALSARERFDFKVEVTPGGVF